MPALILLLFGSDGLLLPLHQEAGVTASLLVRIPPQGQQPGLARVELLITLDGPAEMEVAGVVLEDPLRAWKARGMAGSWSEGAKKLSWGQTIILDQRRPGAMTLPSVRVRWRMPGQEWREALWTEPLGSIQDDFVLEEIPSPEPRWKWNWLIVPGVGIFLILGAGLWIVFHKRKKPAVDSLTATLLRLEDDTISRIQSTDIHQHLAAVLRDFLMERLSLPLAGMTTAETIATLVATNRLSADGLQRLHTVLMRCDEAKFAGRSLPTATANEEVGKTRELIRELARQITASGQDQQERGSGGISRNA